MAQGPQQHGGLMALGQRWHGDGSGTGTGMARGPQWPPPPARATIPNAPTASSLGFGVWQWWQCPPIVPSHPQGHLPAPSAPSGPTTPQSLKLTYPETLDRIKEEFQFLQNQYHR